MELILNISPTVGAFRRLLRVTGQMKNAGNNPDNLGAALDGMIGWLVTYGGVDEETLDALDFGQLAQLIEQAGQAFTLPQAKSAP